MPYSPRFIVTALASALLYLPISNAATQAVPVWPVTHYDDTPTVEKVLGYPAASQISRPEQIQLFFKALAQSHPDRIQLIDYGTSWEGRPLFYAVISSAENLAKLSTHQQAIQRLADPRQTSERDARAIIQDLPGSIWIAASVHGNEIGPAEATLVTAWHLLASQAAETKALLANTLIYIDPLQNPDGRGRFVSRYYATLGLESSADRLSAEHNEPWPNGRTNHYLFDLNRDWFALTQPETQGRVAAFLKALPLYFIDSHEMGGDSSYFFAPSAAPLNPLVTKEQRESLVWLGENNGKWFDTFGFDYFTAEIFDLFYPGYGGNWPNYSGSLANTYEGASARGLHFRRTDGETLTFADTVQRNFVAYMASIETVSNRRQALLERFYTYRKSGIDKAGKQGTPRSYIFPNTRDKAGNHRLAATLVEQGIEVNQAQRNFRACGKDFPAGAYIVDAAQPTHHLIRVLLDQEVPLEPAFLAEQERRRAAGLAPQIYDVTAWSLPLLFNIDVEQCASQPNVATTPVTKERIKPGYVDNQDASYGYVVRWGDLNSGRFYTAALREGLNLRAANAEFTHADGRKFPAGSFVLARSANPDHLSDTVARLARQSGAVVEGLASSWITEGPSIGSRDFKLAHAPNIALLWDEPSSELSAGSTRYVIEREFNYPVTAIRPRQLRSADLAHYQVLILPATGRWGNYQQALGEQGRANLRDWVAKGGVLITLGNATRFATQGEQPLLASSLEQKVHLDTVAEPATPDSTKGRLITSEAHYKTQLPDVISQPDRVPGIIARTQVEQAHWLTAGIPPQLHTLYSGNEIYTPLRTSAGRNVVTFTDAGQLVASGYLWEENRQQIAHKPYLMVQPLGRGQVISFTQEPNFRAYQHGHHLLLLNAIFRGALQATPQR